MKSADGCKILDPLEELSSCPHSQSVFYHITTREVMMLIDTREFGITSSQASTLNSNSMIYSGGSQTVLIVTVVSVLQAGCFFGSLIAYYVADRWGRKVSSTPLPKISTDLVLQPALLIASGITLVGIVIQATTLKHLYVSAVGP
jgi:MFS family permease